VTFTLVTLVVAVIVVLATRGSFVQLAQLSVRWGWVLAVALALQIGLSVVDVPKDRIDDLGFGLLMLSYALLLAFCARNLRVRGIAIIAVGVALNAVVIGLNQGMPTRPDEEKTASGEVIEVPIERTVKHRPQRDGDRLRFLSDVIYPPDPIYEVLSVGDLVIGAGIVVTVYAGSRRRSPRPNASTTRSS
jgi:hypothetical protein